MANNEYFGADIASHASENYFMALWHTYRIPLILTALALLLITRTVLHLKVGREKIVYTPPPTPSEKAPLAANPQREQLVEKAPISAEVKKAGPKRVVGKVTRKKSPLGDKPASKDVKFQVLVFYSTLAGSTERTAQTLTTKLADTLKANAESSQYEFLAPIAHVLAELEDDDEYFLGLPKPEDDSQDIKYFYILLLPTYNIDTMTDTFIEHLQETHNDFRIDTAPMSAVWGYAVFGFGDREGWPTEAEGFCSQATEVDRWMAKLTARKRAFPLGMGDTKVDAKERLDEWRQGVEDVLQNLGQTGNLGEGVVGSGDADESDVEEAEDDDVEVQSDGAVKLKRKSKKKVTSSMDDVEDIGRILQKGQDESEEQDEDEGAIDFTTYGKKNPKPTAAPKEMVPKGSPTYNALTKQGYTIALRALPRRRTDLLPLPQRIHRYAAQRAHLLLPRLHAQHPGQLATLKPVTQLYVSIDASNRESLRKIDRPLHRDFWERFQRCLEILREKRFEQRTVFRLTLVKGFNIEDEAEGYADLVEKGLPCFVEVKGVTYCGTSSSGAAGLTMQNVPFYEEVCAFVLALTAALDKRGLKYGIAAEHAHSCCILIASDRFKKEGKWHTRIDYAKFFEHLESGKPFTPEDYMGPETPEWATWGNGGFDPRDERVYRKGKNK
ncbi:hypothetical protein VE04_09918, partial [Pseudogymnoascus sp. 24MN13]